jgi:hypothetical protein
MNQSFAFEFLCENFQPKLINFYSNFKRFFHFLLCDLGVPIIILSFNIIFQLRVFNHQSNKKSWKKNKIHKTETKKATLKEILMQIFRWNFLFPFPGCLLNENKFS